jgi:Zn-finger nucleic acid-binding protein
MGWHHLACWEELGHCAACGRRRHLGVRAAVQDQRDPGRCPACDTADSLQEGTYESLLRMTFCTNCWGSWVPLTHLGPLLLTYGSTPFEGDPSPRGPRPRLSLSCLHCHGPMTKWSWQDLVLDVCSGHGVWLESGDLLHLMQLGAARPGELYELMQGLGLASDEGPALR